MIKNGVFVTTKQYESNIILFYNPSKANTFLIPLFFIRVVKITNFPLLLKTMVKTKNP